MADKGNGGKRRADLSGQKFGRYTVLRHDTETVKNGGRMPNYICQCDCGSEPRSVGRQCLVRGDATSCGCLHKRNNNHDLVGQVFGRWTVLSRDRSKTGASQNSKYLCRCECGNEKSVPTRNLLNSDSQSCGCLQKERTSDCSSNDLLGQRFGRWTVVERDRSKPADRKGTNAWWICACDCGTTRPVNPYSLTSGKSQSCGCLHKEKVTGVVSSNRTHGETRSRLYSVWAGMKARCSDKNLTSYANYGGRGINVCESWNNKYESFRDWAKQNGYAENLTLERKDVNGNYCPENCCFIPLSDQGKNKRNTVIVKAWGEEKRIGDWLVDPRCKVRTEETLRTRLARHIDPEKAIGVVSLYAVRSNKSKQNTESCQ